MVTLTDVPTLKSVVEYDDLLNRLISAGTPVATDSSNDCLNGRGLGFSIPEGKRSVIFPEHYIIYSPTRIQIQFRIEWFKWLFF